MDESRHENSQSIPERLLQAMNAHDLEAFLACFDRNYQSEQPVHPDRGFGGRDQVRKNWSTIFQSIPDFRAELLRSIADDNTVWSEWDWSGTQANGSQLHMRGVIIMGVQDDRITWGRLYVEPVTETGHGIDAAVSQMAGKDKQA